MTPAECSLARQWGEGLFHLCSYSADFGAIWERMIPAQGALGDAHHAQVITNQDLPEGYGLRIVKKIGRKNPKLPLK